MSRRIECRSEGCANEVLFRTLDGPFDDRRGGAGGRSPLSDSTGRGSPSSTHLRHSNSSVQVSPFCKHHTCVHFLGDERCTYKKPPHDSVCAIHARCPVPNCTQARAQYLEPNFDPLSSAPPRYVRFEVCSDHKCALQRCPSRRASSRVTFCQAHACQADGCTNLRQEQRTCCEEHECKMRGCRTIVDAEFPYCAAHIKCQTTGCGEARHLSTKTNEYLAHCTSHVTCPVRKCATIRMENSAFCGDHTCHARNCLKPTNSNPFCEEHCCAEPSCQNPQGWAVDPKYPGKFCPLHTCRDERCREYVDRLAMFCSTHGCSKPKCHQIAIAERLCIDHFKDYYITHGQRLASPAGPRHNPHIPLAPPGLPRTSPHGPERTTNQDHDRRANRKDSASKSSDEEPHPLQPRVMPVNLPARPKPLSFTQPKPVGSLQPSPRVEFVGPPPRSAGLTLQIPPADGAGGGSAGRPVQGRRAQVEDGDEDSDGWGGEN